METRAIWPAAGLEVRKEGKSPVIRGRFPYGELAVLADRGKVRKERIMPGAFDFTLNDPDLEVNLLFGHDFNMPLASRQAGSLVLKSDDTALSFIAMIAAELLDVGHIRDALALLGAGLVTGISPGFRVPPPDVVKSEQLDPEPGNPGVFIRTLLALVLYELSLVTRPAYAASQAELRALQTQPHPVQHKGIWLP